MYVEQSNRRYIVIETFDGFFTVVDSYTTIVMDKVETKVEADVLAFGRNLGTVMS